MAERLFRLLNIVDSWLFPEKITCLCCDSALGDDEQDGLCPGCTQALARLGGVFQTAPPPAGIHSAFAAFPYADQPRKLILMLKFESVRAAALPLAQAMSALPLGESDALVPVPTTRRRLRQRGFNQARLLAAGACRVSLVTAAKTIPESGDPLFVPVRDIPSFVQDDAP